MKQFGILSSHGEKMLLIMSIFILGCTVTTSESKTPHFSSSLDSLSMKLRKIQPCEHINVSGVQIIAGKDTNTVLSLRIENPIGSIDKESGLREIGEQLAKVISKEIQPNGDFKNIKVLFARTNTSATVAATNTQTFTYAVQNL